MNKRIPSFILFLILFTNSVKSQTVLFTVIDSVPPGAYGTAAWGDFDNDGWKDLAYLTQAIPFTICKIYHNVNNHMVEVNQHFPLLFNPAAKWADLNNDGFEDLVVNGMDSTGSGSTYIYESNGNGTFNSISNTVTGFSAGSVDIADMNRDGLKDLAVTGFDSNGFEQAYIFRNNGNFNFSNTGTVLEGIHFGELKWGDFDNDSLPDLAINGIGLMDQRLRLYHNLGNDSFAVLPVTYPGTSGTFDWLDYNNDGLLDFFITGTDSTFSGNITQLYRNDGNGNFNSDTCNIPQFGEPSAACLADFNNDSLTDICLIGGTQDFPISNSGIFYGTGTSLFSLFTGPYRADILNMSLDAADIDNDGDEDLILSNYILRNDGVVAGVNDVEKAMSSFSVYPNPAQDEMVLSGVHTGDLITIFNAEGKIIETFPFDEKIQSLSILNFTQGFYFVTCMNKSGELKSQKIFVGR
ncbi:MAG TPA: T9SS type A sorting domain-containing protein [Bacteroidia bacterium]|nr:T9SS type A sorting domain-containing protein [Bacteroidia bacterium]